MGKEDLVSLKCLSCERKEKSEIFELKFDESNYWENLDELLKHLYRRDQGSHLCDWIIVKEPGTKGEFSITGINYTYGRGFYIELTRDKKGEDPRNRTFKYNKLSEARNNPGDLKFFLFDILAGDNRKLLLESLKRNPTQFESSVSIDAIINEYETVDNSST